MERTLKDVACHRLAGQILWIDQGLPELQPFRLGGHAFQPPNIPTSLRALAKQPPTLVTNGWLADRFSRVSLWWDKDGVLMEIPAAGYYWTARDGGAICQVTPFPRADPAFLVEALLGPPLVLALAFRNVWCLHASAVEYAGKVMAFLGESGSGKSTLAAALAQEPGVRLVTDDILPVAWDRHAVNVRPQFPQLKLSIDQQPSLKLPEKLPLAVIYLLEQLPTISIGALEPVDSVLALAAHTVAARLFDRQLLSQHLAFCGQAVSTLSLHRLAYPRRRSALSLVWRTLQDDLAVLDV